MSKITNDGLTRSGTGCFIAIPIWQQWVSKGIMYILRETVMAMDVNKYSATTANCQQRPSGSAWIYFWV